MASVCPSCRTKSLAQLAVGELCAQCKAAEAWQQAADGPLVIDQAAIAEAASRRAGEAAGESLLVRAAAWLPTTITALGAVSAGYIAYKLIAARKLGPLGELLADIHREWKLALVIGIGAMVAGIAALIRTRRSRHHRKVPMIASHVLAIGVGSVATVVGGLHGVAGVSFGGHYTMMPPPSLLDQPPHVQRIVDATVVVLSTDADGDARGGGLGTGAVIATDNAHAWIVTCSHVAMPWISPSAPRRAREAPPVWVQLADGREGIAYVRWAAPPPLDVVLVEFPIDNPPKPVPIAPDSSALDARSQVTFVPNPFRDGWLVHHGKVLERETHRTPAGAYDLVMTDLPVQHGDSGSGLFDARGQLVGVNTWARFGGGTSRGISLPSETMATLIDAIEHGGIARLGELEGKVEE